MLALSWWTDNLRRGLAPLVLGACVMLASGAAAEIYQWTDESGQTVFSERPPAEAAHQQIKPKFSKGSPSALDAQNAPAPTREDPQANADQAAETPPEPTPAEKKANCASARDILTHLQTANRLRAKNEQGEIVYLPEEDRPQRIDDAEKSIQSWCN